MRVAKGVGEVVGFELKMLVPLLVPDVRLHKSLL